jgi:hypothetical protein
MVETVGVDLDIEAEGEEGISGMVVPRGMEATRTMNPVVKGLKSHGAVGIWMVAEEEAEVALGEATVAKAAATLGLEIVAVGGLAGKMVTVVVTETGTVTMSKGPSVKAVAGRPTGMAAKEAAKEVKHLRKASLAGKRKIRLVEMIRQEIVTQTSPGVGTDHLPLSWVSQAVMLTSLAHGVLLVAELEAEVPGERAMKIAGIPQEEPQRSLHGAVGQKLLPRKMMMAHGGKAARERAMKIAGIPQAEPQRSLHGVVGQKLLPRKMMMARGGAAAEEVAVVPGTKWRMVAAVPGTKQRMVHGTAARVAPPAEADGKRATQ